ncbi:MAG: hypothetical protein FD123_2304 [Bacteroidetes bacterium]|nr:MAG: hypothetical protein FD123_2304 [Bacteroidota bacterium]
MKAGVAMRTHYDFRFRIADFRFLFAMHPGAVGLCAIENRQSEIENR